MDHNKSKTLISNAYFDNLFPYIWAKDETTSTWSCQKKNFQV